MENNIFNLDKQLLTSQYDKFSYPEKITDIAKEIKNNNLYINYDPKYFWNRLWPEKKYENQKLNVLIAGCGSNQASILAFNNPNHQFTGIDLSIEAIKNNELLIKKHEINNLKVLCDDFRNYQAEKKFDLIFLDPPFKDNKINQLIEKIKKMKITSKDSLIIIHRNKKIVERKLYA